VTDDVSSVNRAHWDELARLHAALPAPAPGEPRRPYDTAALVRGESSLVAVEAEGLARAVGDVGGLDVLHAQCHLGFDAISLARMGARVTGLDFSATALELARDLAERCDTAVDWCRADAVDPPPHLANAFDLVYATFGILCWIEDVDAWMSAMHRVLRPSGKLLLVDLHPTFLMVASTDPLELDFPYLSRGPQVFEEPGSYAAPDAAISHVRTVEFAHGLGQIVTSAARAGFAIDELDEQLEVEFDPRGGVLDRHRDGWYRLIVGGESLPVTYRLIATRLPA
jgi:SAM-dependent methyltransferase